MSDEKSNDRETHAYRKALVAFLDTYCREIAGHGQEAKPDTLRALAKSSHEHTTIVMLDQNNEHVMLVTVGARFSEVLSAEVLTKEAEQGAAGTKRGSA